MLVYEKRVADVLAQHTFVEIATFMHVTQL